MLYLGVDIGGTKLAVGLVDCDGKQLHHRRTETLAAQGPQRVMQRLIELSQAVVREANVAWADIAAAGVGCGGPLDAKAGIVQAPVNLPGWKDIPVVRMLRESFGRPVFLDNDANAAASGEHHFGAGRGVANMVYLTISTGIGGGVIIDNRLYQGENGNAGEIGHMSVDYDGPPCLCGSRGCLELYASGTGIAARARAAISATAQGAKSILADGRVITGKAVVEAARQGDPTAVQIWDETMRILGMGLTNVVHVFNPRRVILGGGITGAGDMLFVPVRRHVAAHAMKQLMSVVEIVPAQLGDAVGILGAAAIAMDQP